MAIALGIMTGSTLPTATEKSEGQVETDYTKYLRRDALKGARIGVVRDFTGQDPDVDWAVNASLTVMRGAGATVVDSRLPGAARSEGGVL